MLFGYTYNDQNVIQMFTMCRLSGYQKKLGYYINQNIVLGLNTILHRLIVCQEQNFEGLIYTW